MFKDAAFFWEQPALVSLRVNIFMREVKSSETGRV